MYIGTISKRYAQALMDFACERQQEDAVYRQVNILLRNYTQVPTLRSTIDNPMVSEEDKLSLLCNAIAGTATCEPLERFFRILLENKREKMLVFMMYSFLYLYRKEKQIYKGRLLTAIPVPEQTFQTLKASILRVHPGNRVEFETQVAPDIIGGYILEIENVRIDASIAGQLQSVKNQFIEKNRRIV